MSKQYLNTTALHIAQQGADMSRQWAEQTIRMYVDVEGRRLKYEAMNATTRRELFCAALYLGAVAMAKRGND